jgi:hypothetical protein
MSNRGYRILILFSLLAIAGCTKDKLQPVNSDKLQKAILAGNPDEAEAEINKVCATLPEGADSELTIQSLTRAISVQCRLTAVVLCHNCIATRPAQSEIKISVNYQGLLKDKIIDITRMGNKYIFAGMHD